MHRARTRVLVAPEWSSNTTTNAAYDPGAEPSLRERLSQLVSDGADGDRTATAAEPSKPADSAQQLEPNQPGANAATAAAVAPSPCPEPAAAPATSASHHQVLYPPPVPPYAPVRSAWPEPALVDLLKQQALFPTDVNLRFSCPAPLLGPGAPAWGAVGAPHRAALRALSEEAQASITAAPASASFQFVQLLAELCGRAGAGRGGSVAPSSGGDGQGGPGCSAGQGPASRRPAPPAPALALAAAASGRGTLPQLEATALGAPAALVGFEGDWLAVQPAVLPYWDKVSLEPCGPPKAAQYYVVCGEQHSSAARMFVRDVSATFLAMRLGTHAAGRTPSHLHSIDGVIPVPLDPGPGPPPSQAAPADGAGGTDAAAAAAVTAALGWHPLARRPDPAVIRSAVLGFRSNHATASVAGEPAWTPDEPCYRPRQVLLGPSTTAPAAAGGSAAATQPTTSSSSFGSSSSSSSPLCHYWRNLRHVGRQLQRHLLLQPYHQYQQQQRDAGGRSGATGRGNGSAEEQQQQDAGPPALVVYLVPPSDAEGDVLRALMELTACLAPVTPAARAPPAPVPLAAPGRRDGDAVAVAEPPPPPQRRPSLQQSVQEQVAAHAPGCNGGSGAAAAARSASAQDAGFGSAASTPPEPPACSSTAAASSSAVPDGGGGGDATDPALLARLGGAARHLYRAASCGAASAAAGGGGGGPAGSLQLDLTQLAAMDVTVQVVLPSSLYDITGASVRATACAAYTKLCRRRAGYGAAAAAAAAPGASAMAPAEGRGGAGAAGGESTSVDVRCVTGSCSGRTILYESLVALAPLALPAAAAADDEAPAAAALPPPPPPPPLLPHQRALSPQLLREGGSGAVGSPLRGAAHHAHQQQQQEYGTAPSASAVTVAAALPPPAPPTLHGCYSWWRCPLAARGATPSPPAALPPPPQPLAEGTARSGCAGACHGPTAPLQPLPPQLQPLPPQQQPTQRCWLAMTFCDAEGKVLDARAVELRFDPPSSSAGSADPGHPQLAAPPQPCSCRPGAAVAAAGARDASLGLSGRCHSTGGAVAPSDDGTGGVPPEGWGQAHSTGPAPPPSRQPSQAQTAAAAVEPAAASSLDALVCRTVLGHARLLCRQLAEAYGSDAGGVAASLAGCSEPGVSPGGAAAAGARRRGGRAGTVTLTLAKLGPPTSAEAAEWHGLLQSSAAGSGAGGGGGVGERRGSGASLRRRWDQVAPVAPVTSPAASAGGGTAGGGAAAAAGGSGGEPAVTLAWLEPHSSLPTQPGCRLPQGGFVVAGPANLPPPQSPQPPFAQAGGGGGSGSARAAVSLVAFPAQRPPSASCAAVEPLNRHLRLLSVHPFPRCQQHQRAPPAPTGGAVAAAAAAPAAAAGTADGKQQHPNHHQTLHADTLQANGPVGAGAAAGGTVNHKRPAACSPGHSPGWDDGGGSSAAAAAAAAGDGGGGPNGGGLNGGLEQQASGCLHPHKRRRWGERADGGGTGGGAEAASSLYGGGGTVSWSDPGWSSLRELYGLCLLRDWLLAAQSGARGGPTPGRRQAAAAAAAGGWIGGSGGGGGDWDDVAGGDADGGSDAPLLLPLHAAVCRQLLRMLAACEQLAAEA